MAATMYYYAYLNSEDIVEQIFDMPAPITSPQYISIPSHDETLIGKRYNRTTGQFEEVIEYVQVTEADKRLWDGKPIATFALVKNEQIAGGTEKTYTIPFNTAQPGYMPRKVVIQARGTNSGGVGQALELTESTIVVMERDEDDTRRMYVKFSDANGQRGEGYVSDPQGSEIFYWRKDSNAEQHYTGGQAFLSKSSDSGGKYVYIGRFTFDQSSVSFTIQTPAEYPSLRTAINLQGWVY